MNRDSESQSRSARVSRVSRPPRRWERRRSTWSSSTSTTTICSSRCSIRSRPPGFRRRYRLPDPADPEGAVEHDGARQSVQVDLARKEAVADERRIGFDRVILATGARHAYFGHDEWEKYARA